MPSLNDLPDWLKPTVAARLTSAEDVITEIRSRAFLGSLQDFKQVNMFNNPGQFSVQFVAPPQTIVRGSTSKIVQPATSSSSQINSSNDVVIGTRIAGSYGVLIKALNYNHSAIRLWKNHPLHRGSYGYISLNKGGIPTENKSIIFDAQYVIALGVVGAINQFSTLLALEKENGTLDDWCLDSISIRLDPSVSAAIGFLPVYEQWQVEISHGPDSNLATAAGFAAIGAAVVLGAAAVGIAGAAEVLAGGAAFLQIPPAAIGATEAIAALGASTAVVTEIPLVAVDVLTVGSFL